MSTPITPEVDQADSLYPSDSHHQQQQQTPDTGVTISPAVAAAPYPSNTVSTPIRNAFRRALAHHHHHHNSSLPSSCNPPQNDSTHLSSISIHRMDPQEIANQLTLMESTLFCQIPPSELMAAQKKKSAPALHVKAMVHQSTLLVYWISNTILGESDAKIRVMVIKFWIKVADVSRESNDEDITSSAHLPAFMYIGLFATEQLQYPDDHPLCLEFRQHSAPATYLGLCHALHQIQDNVQYHRLCGRLRPQLCHVSKMSQERHHARPPLPWYLP
jgi:hypothetical protein